MALINKLKIGTCIYLFPVVQWKLKYLTRYSLHSSNNMQRYY